MRQSAFNLRINSIGASFANLICVHYNIIQLIGYEAANITLLVQQGFVPEDTVWSESFAALFFMFGSLNICFFSPERRPSLLMTGGFLLTLGGLMLILAGYPLNRHIGHVSLARDGPRRHDFCQPFIEKDRLFHIKPIYLILVPYQFMVISLVNRLGSIGRFILNRPFVVGAIIKVSMRLEFIIKNLLAGDLIGMAIGLSWMILGDGGLALNDEKLRQRLSPDETS